MRDPNPIRVLYILGHGRSGSTLLDLLLAGSAEFATVGQFQDAFRALATPGHRCSCGALVPDCHVWRGFGSRFAAVAEVGRDPFLPLGRRGAEALAAIRFFLFGLAPEISNARREEERKMLSHLQAVARTPWVSDSSKRPLRLIALLTCRWVDLRVVFLHREPRAVAAAKAAAKSARRAGPVVALFSWSVHNLICALVFRRIPRRQRLLLEFEDLVAEPHDSLGRIWRTLLDAESPFTEAAPVVCRPRSCHMLSGNRIREEGERVVKPAAVPPAPLGGFARLVATTVADPVRWLVRRL